MHSDVHCSCFTSLGISSPLGQEHAKARIWPVLSREKNAQKELLIYEKNNALPGLPLSIRITGSSKEEWTHASALKDIIRSIESELEDKILRYSLNLKDCLSVTTLTWPSEGVKPNTGKSWGFGVLRDSRMFRARQQDPKHLALGCSWCHWKGLEA